MTLVTLLGALIIGSLLITAIVYKIQQNQQERRERINALTRRSASLRDSITLLNRLGAPIPLLTEMTNELSRVSQSLFTLAPANTSLQSLLVSDLQQRDLLLKGERGVETDSTCASPEALAEANNCVQAAGQFLQSLVQKQRLSATNAAELAVQLRRLMLDLDVFSHLNAADQSIEANERILAQNHLKHAREALRNTNLEFPEKSLFIQDITERIKQINQSAVIIDERMVAAEIDDTTKKRTW